MGHLSAALFEGLGHGGTFKPHRSRASGAKHPLGTFKPHCSTIWGTGATVVGKAPKIAPSQFQGNEVNPPSSREDFARQPKPRVVWEKFGNLLSCSEAPRSSVGAQVSSKISKCSEAAKCAEKMPVERGRGEVNIPPSTMSNTLTRRVCGF